MIKKSTTRKIFICDMLCLIAVLCVIIALFAMNRDEAAQNGGQEDSSGYYVERG